MLRCAVRGFHGILAPDPFGCVAVAQANDSPNMGALQSSPVELNVERGRIRTAQQAVRG